MTLDSTSLERLVPDELQPGDATGLDTLGLHVDRYQFAARRLGPGRVLDAGCGVGYGTALLAEHQDTINVVGIDISLDAIDYATRRYGGPRIAFRVGDVLTFEDSAGFDGIVAFEIVEHVQDPQALIQRLVALLRPGGILVASVPTTPSTDFNPHHRHDFTERSFRRLFENHGAVGLVEMDCLRQRQRVPIGAVLRRREKRMRDLRRGLGLFYLRHPMTFLHRLQATATRGLVNCYTTLVWRRGGES